MKISDITKAKVATKSNSSVKGYIIYEGASRINGEPIVAIVTMNSKNVKTGNMASMWILHKDLKPTDASKSGADVAVCGDCKLRRFNGGACYVTLHQAPASIFKSYKKGNYKPLENNYEVFENISMRFGAYGDPFAIPMDVLLQIKGRVKNNTSYTHQWRQGNEVLKNTSMASADNLTEAKEAQAQGWRTFRVANEDSEILDNEIVCPNYTKNVQCIDCNLCSGNSVKAKNIVIPVHGQLKSRFK